MVDVCINKIIKKDETLPWGEFFVARKDFFGGAGGGREWGVGLGPFSRGGPSEQGFSVGKSSCEAHIIRLILQVELTGEQIILDSKYFRQAQSPNHKSRELKTKGLFTFLGRKYWKFELVSAVFHNLC